MIDDEQDILDIARLSLELIGGWVVRTAAHGEAGARSAAADPPDVILLDMMMPGMDGAQTVSRLRSDPATAGIPVILMTGLSQSGGDVAGTVAGVIAKPFDPTRLAAEVARILAWPRPGDAS